MHCLRKGLGGLSLLLAIALALTAAAGAWRDAAAQTEGRVPGNTLGQESDSDLWRAIRGGEGGVIISPDARPETVLTAPFSDCVKADNCSETAVGFSMAIHDSMPAIYKPYGEGTSREVMGFLAFVLGVGLIGLALFVRRLGQEGAGEMPHDG
jgi:hypothetical protein